jgi:hypothetical protein
MKRKRSAVVLDCEMVEVTGGQNEVVRLCAVDFLTGQVLVDIYVVPRQRVFAWRTRVSGVTEVLLMEMKRQGRTVDGWQQARALLWEHIDENTILIGHALNNDLNVLGMIHTRIVDSGILARAAVGPNCDYSPGLKKLCQEFLGKDIQTGAAGHSCVEDTFATREVLLWCLRYPDRLGEWAISERALMEKRRAERKEKAEERKREKEKDLPQRTSVVDGSDSDVENGLDDLSENSDNVLVEAD